VGEPAPELLAQVRQSIASSPGLDYAWPGNVRELEQAVRRVLLNRHYEGKPLPEPDDADRALFQQGVEERDLRAEEVLSAYCRLLYRRHGSFAAVGRIAGLDRRTVKKYIGPKGGDGDS
jgi:transcriptional regulator of acetoin/glycerol metabolism